ncbi:MGH1-like glycoside hydrolase domain-containing protein [Pedobacter lusitanus]|uniref:MGH1-like glycoside hydrolase domain-containing protein n=1 Tax=Pedobacter lusitanus TaxID=1503925 RepID=UPI000696EF0D|nr:trehalase family glycosidase [Pedobacter lusitanus]
MKPVNTLLFTLGVLLLSKAASAQHYANTCIPNTLVEQNIFIKKNADKTPPPTFESSKAKLPEPFWPERQNVIRCYWKAWETAFSNLHGATSENGFIKPFIDPAFNQHIFMWDTSFMVLFGRYGHHAFDFQSSMDNFYVKQEKDGYICREISELNGDKLFEKFDVSSTGPNIMPWAEWEYFQNFHDMERLKNVFSPLLAYYQWFRDNRSWPDGSYYSSGWGCGMDNQPRLPAGYSGQFSTGFMSWIDTTLQQIFAGKTLIAMAEKLNRQNEVKDIVTEVGFLTSYVQQHMWSDKTSFFYDRYRDGKLSDVKSIAAYWALLAGVVPDQHLADFTAHLENPKEFARLHRVPTLSADDPGYSADGGYWRGGVWAPTSYMVLRGLTQYKQDSLAFVIAKNHLDNVVQVFDQTGSLWENYAPDKVLGKDRKDLVGWTGLVPISVLFEYVFGLKPEVPENMITWDIRLTDEFGVKKYPFKENGLLDFWCAARKNNTDKPKIKIHSNIPVVIKLQWNGGSQILNIKPDKK